MSGCGVEMIFADALDLPLDQLLGGGDSGVDLARCIERQDTRRIQFERLPALRLPFGDGRIDLVEDRIGLFVLVLQSQDAGEVGQRSDDGL